MKKKIDWPRMVSEFQGSGLTAAEFCRQNRVNAGTLSYHLHKKRHGGKRANGKVTFSRVGAESMIHIASRGVDVKIPTSTPDADLKRIIKALSDE